LHWLFFATALGPGRGDLRSSKAAGSSRHCAYPYPHGIEVQQVALWFHFGISVRRYRHCNSRLAVQEVCLIAPDEAVAWVVALIGRSHLIVVVSFQPLTNYDGLQERASTLLSHVVEKAIAKSLHFPGNVAGSCVTPIAYSSVSLIIGGGDE
jgi:hypothetical protein